MTQLVPDALVDDVRRLIDSAGSRVAATVNAELTLLYWQIGRRMIEGELGGVRAEYGLQASPRWPGNSRRHMAVAGAKSNCGIA